MSYSDNQIVRSAIARNAGIVVSLPSAGLFRHHKSRFLAETEEGIWVEVPPQEKPLIDELIGSSRNTGISFRQGPLKIVFAAPVLRYNPEYPFNAQTALAAAMVACPAEVKTIQRRSNYRAPVPVESELRVRVWRIAPGVPVRDRPLARQELKAKLRNLGIGGVGVTFETTEEGPMHISPQDRLRICLVHGDGELVLEGRLRYPEVPMGPRARVGLQFKSLNKDMDGRQALTLLTRIVGELTRAELRRMRQGISTPEAA